jgi:HEAT repeats/HEAT repeat
LLHNFENLRTNGASAVPALIHWANDPDYWVRDGVVSALGGIGERPGLAVPVLTNALEHDSNSMVRRDAAEALGSFANDSEAVLPELIKTLKDPDWQAREGAPSGLGKIQNKPEVVVPLIAPVYTTTTMSSNEPRPMRCVIPYAVGVDFACRMKMPKLPQNQSWTGTC